MSSLSGTRTYLSVQLLRVCNRLSQREVLYKRSVIKTSEKLFGCHQRELPSMIMSFLKFPFATILPTRTYQGWVVQLYSTQYIRFIH